MTLVPFDSKILSPLLSDADTAAQFSDAAAVRAMLEFEAALARVEERMGLVPDGAGAAVAAAASGLELDWGRLGRGSVQAGHPVADLVDQLRARAGSFGDAVHRGATAQDVMDTALVLNLRVALDRFDARLLEIAASLTELAERHRDSAMAGRTRSQQAVPVTFGLKAAGWLLPIVRHRQRLAELRPRVLVVQFGGAAGTLAVLGGRGEEVVRGLADELSLGVAPMPWHSQRDGLVELAGWCSLVTATLAKFGADVSSLAQTEVGEVRDGSDGVSSAMPHKENPVRSETLVAIGRANASLLAGMHHAAVHEHERSGSAWTLEWLTLPQMAVLTGSSLGHARAVAGSMSVDPGRMLSNIEAAGGLALAEAAVATLSEHVPFSEARRLVKRAARLSRQSGEPFLEVLEREAPDGIDWTAVRDPANWLGSAKAFADRAVAAARAAL